MATTIRTNGQALATDRLAGIAAIGTFARMKSFWIGAELNPAPQK